MDVVNVILVLIEVTMGQSPPMRSVGRSDSMSSKNTRKNMAIHLCHKTTPRIHSLDGGSIGNVQNTSVIKYLMSAST